MKKKKMLNSMKTRKKLINIKVHDEEFRAIVSLANKYAKGKYSTWVRHAALNYRPTKEELV